MTERRGNDQRSASRQVVYVASEIVTDAGAASCAVTHDASRTGLLLLTRAKVEIGQPVRLRVHTRDGTTPSFEVTGRVVRRESLGPSESDVWRTKVGIVLDEGSSELATELDALARKQASVFGAKR